MILVVANDTTCGAATGTRTDQCILLVVDPRQALWMSSRAVLKNTRTIRRNTNEYDDASTACTPLRKGRVVVNWPPLHKCCNAAQCYPVDPPLRGGEIFYVSCILSVVTY